MQGARLRFGFIDKETEDGVTYAVRFDERDRQVIEALPVIEREHAHPYAVGDRVAVLVEDHADTGLIMGLVPSTENPMPVKSPKIDRRTYSDGAIVEYDATTHKLKATLPDGGTAQITAPGGVTITGDVTISGMLDVSGALGVGGSLGVDGGGSFGTDVTASGTSLKTHIHTAPGGFSPAPTSPPL